MYGWLIGDLMSRYINILLSMRTTYVATNTWRLQYVQTLRSGVNTVQCVCVRCSVLITHKNILVTAKFCLLSQNSSGSFFYSNFRTTVQYLTLHSSDENMSNMWLLLLLLLFIPSAVFLFATVTSGGLKLVSIHIPSLPSLSPLPSFPSFPFPSFPSLSLFHPGPVHLNPQLLCQMLYLIVTFVIMYSSVRR